MLLNRHGPRILRVKGILDLADEARPVAVHGVQHLVHPPTHRAAWPEGQRSSRLVFIVDGIEEARIRTSFEVFAGSLGLFAQEHDVLLSLAPLPADAARPLSYASPVMRSWQCRL